MSWITDIFRSEKPQEQPAGQPQATRAEKSKHDFYTNTYTFEFSSAHFINGIISRQQVKGVLERKLLGYNYINKMRRWGIAFRNMEYDWNETALPQIYSLHEAVTDIELTIKNDGTVLAAYHPTTDLEASRLWESKWKGLKAHFEDKAKALLYFQSISKHLGVKKFVRRLMQNHPALQPFYKIAALEQRDEVLTNTPDPQIAGMQKLDDYFGKDQPLPLKTCWLKRKEAGTTSSGNVIWVQVGGLDKENFNEAAFAKYMRTIGDNILISDTELHLDYSGYYEVTRPQRNIPFLDLAFSETYLETAVPGIWYKEEQTVLRQISPID